MSLIIGVDDEEMPKVDLGDKIRELCEALVADENVIAARQRVERFLGDPAATASYARLVEKSEELQRKEMGGTAISEEEGKAFEDLRRSTLTEPAVQSFMEARGMLQEMESFIMAYVSRTLELGRIPRENELTSGGGGGGGGGCGEGCGCH
ncbi:MAG: YlbF family regulator [Verrucomicrobiota bacterium]